jgi:tRNA threonylcarbamoyladenosine biosynthesis protein TsaE
MNRLRNLEGAAERRTVRSDSPARTHRIGERIGAGVPAGTVLSLEGGLGAGKTVLAKGICKGLGVDDEVVSPSFILMEEYRGVYPVFHFDLYRLDELGDVEGIGLYEAIDGRNVVIVEWGDRLPEGALHFDVRVRIAIRSAEDRDIDLTAPPPLIDLLTGA